MSILRDRRLELAKDAARLWFVQQHAQDEVARRFPAIQQRLAMDAAERRVIDAALAWNAAPEGDAATEMEFRAAVRDLARLREAACAR